MSRLFTELRWVRAARWDRRAVFGVVAVGAYMAMLLISVVLSRVTGVGSTTGLFRRVTDVPCPLCRGSRAAESLAHADLLGAIVWNPLATALLIFGVIWLIVRFGFARRLELRPTRLGRRVLWSLATLGIIANWVYVIAMGG